MKGFTPLETIGRQKECMRSLTGFTLIEILFGVAIFSILILAIFAVMNVGIGAWFSSDVSVQLRQEIIKAFTKMEKELKETRPAQISLTIGTSSSSLTFKIPHDNNNDGTILDSFGNIEWSGNIMYALNGANEITRTASGVTSVLARNVVNLQFSRPTSPVNLLQIDITARKVSTQRRTIQDTGQITTKMRN
jgi:prepilin-type N-terminal cleavage/methylation domain-containing protein